MGETFRHLIRFPAQHNVRTIEEWKKYSSFYSKDDVAVKKNNNERFLVQFILFLLLQSKVFRDGVADVVPTKQWSFSLFHKIPLDRNCDDAMVRDEKPNQPFISLVQIPLKWCACVEWIEETHSSAIAQTIALVAIADMNKSVCYSQCGFDFGWPSFRPVVQCDERQKIEFQSVQSDWIGQNNRSEKSRLTRRWSKPKRVVPFSSVLAALACCFLDERTKCAFVCCRCWIVRRCKRKKKNSTTTNIQSKKKKTVFDCLNLFRSWRFIWLLTVQKRVRKNRLIWKCAFVQENKPILIKFDSLWLMVLF